MSTLGTDPAAKVAGDVQVGLGASATPLAVRSRPRLRRTAGARADGGHRRRRPGARAWSPAAPSRPRSPPSTARRRWPTSGSPRSAPAPPTTPWSSWSTRTPARPSPTSRSARPTASLDVPALRGVSVPGGTQRPARPRPGRAAPRASSRSRCTPAAAGWPCTSSTATTSSAPVPAARTGCPPRPSRPPATCCSAWPRARASARWCSPTPAPTRCGPRSRWSRRPRSSRPTGVERDPGGARHDRVRSRSTTCSPRPPRTAPPGCSSRPAGPVTATLRQVVDDDLSLLTPAPELDATTAVVVPAGPKRLLLAGADAVGTATVTSYAARREAAGPAAGRARPRARARTSPSRTTPRWSR